MRRDHFVREEAVELPLDFGAGWMDAGSHETDPLIIQQKLDAA